jgi:uncharacterized protein (DUF1800 family)
MEIKKVIHLYNRFGFGVNAVDIKKLSNISFEEKLEKESVDLLKLDYSEFEGTKIKMSEAKKMALRRASRKKLIELNVSWMERMISSENIVQEKMNLFWHHHFSCIMRKPIHAQQFSNIIRQNATGDFKKMVLDISKSAAMIRFLHTKQNQKNHPNEDLARELCEIYTLGLDKEYTEQDIQEIARCFTGWKYHSSGAFFIKSKEHDYGNKTIFNKTGSFNGEDVIDLILEKRACSYYICENFYKYFVNPIVNPAHVNELSNLFYSSNYDIKQLIIHIANSEWFYADKNILAKIKSPIELIVGLSRQFKIESSTTKSWITFQKMFDQELFRPPNVKGWKENQEWIDSNSLPLRLRLPSIILSNAELNIGIKPDYDENPNQANKQNRLSKKLGFTCDWNYFFEQNEGIDFKQLFFNNKVSGQVENFLQSRKFDSKKEEVIQLISLPEYQLI